jgi:hypothetical protein
VPGLPGVHYRNDALAMIKSLMDFPVTPDVLQYAAWRACIDALLEFSRQRSGVSRARSQSVLSPAHGAATAIAASCGAARLAPAPAPGAVAQPAEAPHVSVGSSLSSPERRDAREIINDRRTEDGRVTIERHHHQQWRRANEVDARTAGTGAVDYGGGCLALRPSLCQVNWPSKFHPSVPVMYDGDTNPTSFLQIYSTAMVAAGADQRVMPTGFRLP